MRIVAFEHEILDAEAEQIAYRCLQSHRRQGTRSTRQLQARLFEMIAVQVCIPKCMHEIARPVAADLRQHQGQQRVGSDVEGYAEKNVGAALVELAGKLRPVIAHRNAAAGATYNWKSA
jgi:hypothetical protein